jgi:hypothetical protein
LKTARRDIPEDVAAEVLFRSDRCCCVCRVRGRPTQVHHIDGNPANSVPENLAVLCLECHNDTLLRGGFDRKLDAAQVTLYRDDWYAKVEDVRKTMGLPRTSDADLARTASPEVFDHDRRVFRDADALLPETRLTDVLAQLYNDDSYQGSQFEALPQYVFYLSRAENEFILDPLVERTRAMLSAFRGLIEFTASHFFDWPRSQTGTDWRFCLHPDLNVDRGGYADTEGERRYDQRQQELTALVQAAHVAWRDLRRAVKRLLLV